MICLSLFFFVVFILIAIITCEPLRNGITPFIICFILSLLSAFDHFRDLSTIRMGSEYIEAQHEAIRELDIQMENISLSIPKAALLNADSPYKSLIELKGERIKQLTDTKLEVINAKKSLMQRKMGINRDAVWFFGDK